MIQPLGIIEVGILNFKDNSIKSDYTDIYIEIKLSVKKFENSYIMPIRGKLKTDLNGLIIGGKILSKFYNIFDTIGCIAGTTIEGKWEGGDGISIPDIGEYLNKYFKTTKYRYLTYAYKERLDDNVYTNVYPKLFYNTPDGYIMLNKCIEWEKSQGFIN